MIAQNGTYIAFTSQMIYARDRRRKSRNFLIAKMSCANQELQLTFNQASTLLHELLMDKTTTVKHDYVKNAYHLSHLVLIQCSFRNTGHGTTGFSRVESEPDPT